MVTDKIDFLIFEKDAALYDKIRSIIIGFSVRESFESEIYLFNNDDQLFRLSDYVRKVHVALINADYDDISLDAARTVFNEDEDVLIVFYGRNRENLKPYFKTRPIAYLDLDNNPSEILQIINDIRGLLYDRKRVFTWTNKSLRVFIPYGKILYMQSYKGYVSILTTGDKEHRILAKLDSVQETLGDDTFLRIHKSTLVNRNHIVSVDRSHKSCLMSNGDTVYISKAYYKAAAESLL